MTWQAISWSERHTHKLPSERWESPSLSCDRPASKALQMSIGPDWPLHFPSGKHSYFEPFILDNKQSRATELVFKGQEEQRWMERIWCDNGWQGRCIKLQTLCPRRGEWKRRKKKKKGRKRQTVVVDEVSLSFDFLFKPLFICFAFSPPAFLPTHVHCTPSQAYYVIYKHMIHMPPCSNRAFCKETLISVKVSEYGHHDMISQQ